MLSGTILSCLSNARQLKNIMPYKLAPLLNIFGDPRKEDDSISDFIQL